MKGYSKEDIKRILGSSWPTTTGQVKGMQVPNGDYKQQIPK